MFSAINAALKLTDNKLLAEAGDYYYARNGKSKDLTKAFELYQVASDLIAHSMYQPLPVSACVAMQADAQANTLQP